MSEVYSFTKYVTFSQKKYNLTVKKYEYLMFTPDDDTFLVKYQ